MSPRIKQLEQTLATWFSKNTPELAPELKKTLKAWAPIIALVVGVISAAKAWTLWRWASRSDRLLGLSYDTCMKYDGANCGNSPHISVWIWLNLAFLVAVAVLCLRAYPALQRYAKQGWNYLFYATLLTIAYAVVSFFTDYRSLDDTVITCIGAGLCLYLLFHMRGEYTGTTKPKRQHPTAAQAHDDATDKNS